jgi:hypothetical protein
MKIRAYGSKALCSNKFTWCFHKQNYYMFYRHANIQRTYYSKLVENFVLEDLLQEVRCTCRGDHILQRIIKMAYIQKHACST